MPEIARGRDLILFKKGDHFQVTPDANLVSKGWPGGQGVKWAPSGKDDFTVTFSDGECSGFLLWGSDEAGDRYTAMSANQPYYKFAVMYSGGCFFSTSTFEKYTYTSRLGGGPYVPLTYNPNDFLFLSLRGLWTTEDEWDLSGDPRGPLADRTFVCGLTAMVIKPPSAITNQFMTIQTL